MNGVAGFHSSAPGRSPRPDRGPGRSAEGRVGGRPAAPRGALAPAAPDAEDAATRACAPVRGRGSGRVTWTGCRAGPGALGGASTMSSALTAGSSIVRSFPSSWGTTGGATSRTSTDKAGGGGGGSASGSSRAAAALGTAAGGACVGSGGGSGGGGRWAGGSGGGSAALCSTSTGLASSATCTAAVSRAGAAGGELGRRFGFFLARVPSQSAARYTLPTGPSTLSIGLCQLQRPRGHGRHRKAVAHRMRLG